MSENNPYMSIYMFNSTNLAEKQKSKNKLKWNEIQFNSIDAYHNTYI